MEIVTQTTQNRVTPELATAASMLVRLAQPGNQSLHRALAKAEDRLMTQPWRVDDGVLHIVSVSHPNEVHLTDGVDCSCPTTRGCCYHTAAHAILSTLAAAGCSPVANLPLPMLLDESELPGSFLDGPFDAFDDDSLTHDQYGRILPAFAPAFEEVDDVPAAPFRLQPSREHANPLNADVDALFAA